MGWWAWPGKLIFIFINQQMVNNARHTGRYHYPPDPDTVVSSGHQEMIWPFLISNTFNKEKGYNPS